jgi:HK97 gp10 family phage protein
MTLSISNIERVQAGLAAAVDDGARATAEAIKAIRDPLTPVDTGELLRSDLIEQIESGHYRYSEGNGLPDDRAIFTEYGTIHAAAQPHFTPAVEQVDMLAIMQQHLAALIGGGA